MNGPRAAVGPVVGSILWLTAAGGIAVAGSWNWDGSLAMGGGTESDLVFDSGEERTVVPGGTFLVLAPEFLGRTRLGANSRLHLRGRLEWNRFSNDIGRSLLGGLVAADYVWGGRNWVGRVTIGGTGFDDSARPTVQRVAVGVEASATRALGRWRLELQAGLQGRRYPQLRSYDELGTSETYAERSGELGLNASFVVSPVLLIGGRAAYLRTDAREVLYDSRALTGQLFASWRAARRTRITMSGLWQDRDFAARAPGYDEDGTWQVGVGVDQDLSRVLTLTARWAMSRWELPDYERQDVHRVTVGLVWRVGPSRRAAVSTPEVLRAGVLREALAREPRAGKPFPLRLHEPRAVTVTVVGDFNEWDAHAHPLQRSDDGWWEISLTLPAGSWQYAFLVDGEVVTPPQAGVTVDDGFGGRNGVIVVLSVDEDLP